MQTTKNYGYSIPESSDTVNIEDISNNFSKIDEDLYEVSQKSNSNTVKVNLSKSSWVSVNDDDKSPYKQTVSCSGITNSNDFIVSPVIVNSDDLVKYDGMLIMVTEQTIDSLTFTSFNTAKPFRDLEYNIKIIG